jgi:hypothetical protein
MTQKQILSIAMVILMICFGCDKSDNDSDSDSPDLSAGLAGMYNGNWVVSGNESVSGTCEVVIVSKTSVDLKMTTGWTPTLTIPGVKLSDGGNGKIILKYTDSSVTLNGTIQNNIISVTLVSGSDTTIFTGTNDLSTGLAGMYIGTWVVPGTGSVSGTCEVVIVSKTSVDLKMTAGGTPTPTIPGVKLSDGGNGQIILKYTDSSGTLDGAIQNNMISVTLVASSTTTTFTGTKQ